MSTALNDNNDNNATTSNPKKILVVTGDLPSHPYAAAKLAKVLARGGHSVTLAAPQGPALDRVISETQDCSSNISCIQVGTIAETKKQFNERPVVDPLSWTALFHALIHPFPEAQLLVQHIFDRQEHMYLALQQELTHGAYDLVMPLISTCITVCDAVESTCPQTPVIIFSSLPYDPAVYLGERVAWNMPRSLTTFPHVATYSTIPNNSLLASILQMFWKLLDAWLTARAWARSAVYNNERRARRGLPPIKDGWRGYLQSYPVLSFGGVAPFMDASVTKVASNVTAIGALDSDDDTGITGELQEWLDRQHASTKNGIVYAGFGTGTALSNQEASNITGGLVHYYNNTNNNVNKKTMAPVLFALRASEQQRLRHVIDKAMGALPTSMSKTHLEYFHGRLRIQDSVPQAALLKKKGLVKVFISHFGMGGFVEGVKGGVPFIAYPSGCDQWFNAQRAIDAGIAIRAPVGLDTIGALVESVLVEHDDDNIQFLAQRASQMLKEVNGEQRALDMVEAVVTRSSSSRTESMTLKRQDTPRFALPLVEVADSLSFHPSISIEVEETIRAQSSNMRSGIAEAA